MAESDGIDFSEQVVIVTGAGRGLGRLYALELARRGASVVVNDLGTSMDVTAPMHGWWTAWSRRSESHGGTAVACYDSVDQPNGGARIVELALDEFGSLDAVVSNADILQTAPFEDLTVDDWHRMLRVHLDGAFNLSQPAYRAMKRSGHGCRRPRVEGRDHIAIEASRGEQR
jgi:NAD(P)-dependent dehydrogenase (short-subunit alcohol dehydrogenase family)